jgi:large subunit ribosomal protein L6
MSRVAKAPISVPEKVTVEQKAGEIHVKGPKGSLEVTLHTEVDFELNDNVVSIMPAAKGKSKPNWAMAGTMRALINNAVTGVSEGFVKKLELVGVGYRAQLQGSKLVLSLGFSHPVEHQLPEGVSANVVGNTTIELTSIDKQLLGQTAANIRSYRKPEPYKGKGVRYSDEMIVRKETKKK